MGGALQAEGGGERPHQQPFRRPRQESWLERKRTQRGERGYARRTQPDTYPKWRLLPLLRQTWPLGQGVPEPEEGPIGPARSTGSRSPSRRACPSPRANRRHLHRPVAATIADPSSSFRCPCGNSRADTYGAGSSTRPACRGEGLHRARRRKTARFATMDLRHRRIQPYDGVPRCLLRP